MYVHTHARVRMYIYLYSIYRRTVLRLFFVTIVKCHWLLVTDGLRSASYTIAEPYVHIES